MSEMFVDSKIADSQGYVVASHHSKVALYTPAQHCQRYCQLCSDVWFATSSNTAGFPILSILQP